MAKAEQHETQSEHNHEGIRNKEPNLSCSVENNNNNNINTSSRTTGRNSTFPEGGFGWLVVFAAVWVNGSIFAIQNSFSILHVMIVEFHQAANEKVSQFQIAWVGALSLGMIFFWAPLVSMCTDRFGCRLTAVGGSLVASVGLLTSSFANSLALQYFTYGLLFGAGCSFSLQPSLVILGRYFQRRLGLVNGVVTAGSSLFSMALPVLLEEVLAPLGLERIFQVLSVLPLVQAVLAGVTFRPFLTPLQIDDKREQDEHHCDKDGDGCYINEACRHDETRVADHDEDSCSCYDRLPQAVKHNLQSRSETTKYRTSFHNNVCTEPVTSLSEAEQQQELADVRKFCSLTVFHVPTYRLWSFGVSMAVLGYFVPYVHLMSFVEEQFADSDKKEWILLVCIGASSGIGRLAFGRIGDLLPGLQKLYLQGISLMVLGLASIVIPVCVAFEGLVVVCVILGVCDGCLITLMAPIAFEVLGVKKASQGIGCILGLMALPMTAGPPLAGLLHDHFGNYNLAFYLAGVPPLLGGLLLLFIPIIYHFWWAADSDVHPEPSGASGSCAGDSLPSQNFEHRLNEVETTHL